MSLNMTRRTGLSFLVVSMAVSAASVGAAGLYDELLACRDLLDDATRVACYDAAVDRDQESSISQEDLFGKNQAEIQRTVEEATGNERIESLDGTVTRLQQAGYDKVVITLDNGQVWRQVDASSLRLRVGDAIEIERASLGSYLLQKSGSKRSMRVTRAD